MVHKQTSVKAIFVGLLFLVAYPFFGNDWTRYNTRHYAYISCGSGVGQLWPAWDPQIEDPSFITYYRDQFYISDAMNERVNVYSRNFEYRSSMPFTLKVRNGNISEEYVVAYDDEFGYLANSKTKTALGMEKIVPGLQRFDFYPFGDICFYYTGTGNPQSIHTIMNVKAVLNGSKPIIYDSEQTRALFESKDKRIPKGLLLDEYDDLILNGELITKNLESFVFHWDRIYPGYLDDSRHKRKPGWYPYTKCLGRDTDGNWYWSAWHSIVVYSKDGFMIDEFLVSETGTNTYGAVDDSGDVYLMISLLGEKKHEGLPGAAYGDKVEILKIPRQWGYDEEPIAAVGLDDGLRVRDQANTDSPVVGYIQKNQNITILKTGEKATIGGVTAPWYRVKTEDGLVGWAFGGFIKVTEE